MINKEKVCKSTVIDVIDLFKLMTSEGNVTLDYDGKDEHGGFNYLTMVFLAFHSSIGCQRV